MNLLPNGNFRVAPGEIVNVAVTAQNTMFLAIFSDLLVADWDFVSPPQQVGANRVREVRRFTAPQNAPARESFTLIMDFIRTPGVPIPPGTQYIIELQGSIGNPIQVPVPPVAPFPVDQQFIFEVRP